MKTKYSLRIIPLLLSLIAFLTLFPHLPAFAQHAGHGQPVAGGGLTAQAGPYSVEVVTDPAIVPVGRAHLRITVKDGAGKPIEGATVRALVGMPNMKMG